MRRISLAVGAAFVLGLGAARADDGLPTLQEVLGPLPGEPTKLVDETGKAVGEIFGRRHMHVVRLAQVPRALQTALVDTEDPSFYQNAGFDPRGIARALFQNLLAGKAKQGGSTITQQLAKSLLNDRSRTVDRKVKEAWLTLQLEQQFTKDAILERYLDEVYWGHGAYGVAAAAEVYFGLPLDRLSVGQMAILVGMLRGPALYDPYDDRHLEAALTRRDYVLGRMVVHGHLGRAEADTISHKALHAEIAKKVAAGKYTRKRADARLRASIGLAPPPPAPGLWFRRRTAQVLEGRLGRKMVEEGGLTVTVTMDKALQIAAEKAAVQGIARDGRRFGFSQVAIVAVEPGTGKLRALVGGVGNTEYDRTMAKFQPGSSFKPYVYLTAFARGRRPEETILDAPVRYPAGGGRWYQPRNDDLEHHGQVTLRAALEQSINVPAVGLLHEIGTKPVIDTAKAFGIRSPLESNLTLALGSSAITPLEQALAYAAFANDGVWTQPVIFTQVALGSREAAMDAHSSGQVSKRRSRGNTTHKILERPQPQQVRAADPEAVRTLVDVLQGVLTRGTAAGSAIGRPAAGKTGTSSAFRDAWFVGFTPQLCVAVWVGNDDRKPMRQGAFGGRVAARIWKDVMLAGHKGKPIIAFNPPGGALAHPQTPGASMSTPSPAASSVTPGATESWWPFGKPVPTDNPPIATSSLQQ